jgi:hypothetical protein
MFHVKLAQPKRVGSMFHVKLAQPKRAGSMFHVEHHFLQQLAEETGC